MGDIGGLQFLPTQKKEFSWNAFSGKSILFVISLALIAVLGIAYMFLHFKTSSAMEDIGTLDGKLEAIYSARDKKQEEELLGLNKQLGTTRSLLQAHIYWSQGLGELQNMIEPRVRFTTLNATIDKHTFIFHAFADNYATVARQIAAFYQNENITNVTLSKVGGSGSGLVEFDVELTVKPSLFLLTTPKP